MPIAGTDDENQDFNYLQNWGPRFNALAAMYVHDKAKTKQQQPSPSQVGVDNALAVVATGSGAGPGGGGVGAGAVQANTTEVGKVVL